jgi:hypothetical protein
MATANPLPPPGPASSISDVRRRLDRAQRAQTDAATAMLRALSGDASGDEVLFIARDENELRAWIGATFGPEANETHAVLRTPEELDAYLSPCAPSR